MTTTETEPAAPPVPLAEDLMEVLYHAQHQLGEACQDRACECHLLLIADPAVLGDDPTQWCEPCRLRWARLQAVHYALRHHAGRVRNLTTAVGTAADLVRYFEDRSRRMANQGAMAVVR